MSSQTYKNLEKPLKKDQNFFNAEVINFPTEKKLNELKDLQINTGNYWKISDASNHDQFRAIIGICFMFGALTLMGLYSNLF